MECKAFSPVRLAFKGICGAAASSFMLFLWCQHAQSDSGNQDKAAIVFSHEPSGGLAERDPVVERIEERKRQQKIIEERTAAFKADPQGMVLQKAFHEAARER